MVATSTPAARSAVRATGGAWKVNSLFWAVPCPSVIAVSRFTMVRSASARPGCAEPKTVRGSRASRLPTRSVKWTSPAKLIVNVPGSRDGADDCGAVGDPGGQHCPLWVVPESADVDGVGDPAG